MVTDSEEIRFVVSRWGEPTQTFVRREATALGSLGVDVSAVSLKAPHPTAGLQAHWNRPAQVAVGLPVAVARHPIRLLALLTDVVRLASRRNLAAHLVALAVAASWSGTRRPARHYHAHFGWVAATAAWAAARLEGRTFSVVLHAFELHRDRYWDPFAAAVLRQADLVYAISDHDAAVARARLGVPVSTLRMGTPQAWLEEPCMSAADREPRSLVSVGSLLPKKGHDVLIRAVARTQFPWSLEIYGDGPEHERLCTLIEELGVQQRVQLMGPRENSEIRERLQRVRGAVLASVVDSTGDRDGIPVFLMEAMACGTPVIGADLGGIPELLDGAGTIVPSGDVQALAEAIDALAADDAWNRSSKASRAKVSHAFTVEKSAERLCDALNGLVYDPDRRRSWV